MYGSLISILVNGLILKYVLENEKENCECAMTWHHNFIKLYAPVVILLAFVKLLFKNGLNKAMKTQAIKILFSILGLVSIAYLITLILYLIKIHSVKCKCLRHDKYSSISFAVYILAATLGYIIGNKILYKLIKK